jgi:hypothetical protein
MTILNNWIRRGEFLYGNVHGHDRVPEGTYCRSPTIAHVGDTEAVTKGGSVILLGNRLGGDNFETRHVMAQGAIHE